MTQRFPLQPDHALQDLEYRVELLETALNITPGHKIVLEFGDTKLTLSENEIIVAAKKIVIRAEAEIELASNQMQLKGAGTIQVRAGGELVLKGSKITQN